MCDGQDAGLYPGGAAEDDKSSVSRHVSLFPEVESAPGLLVGGERRPDAMETVLVLSDGDVA